MYESITYAELKSLPRDKKPDAWRELKSLYPTQKDLAVKLGVSPAIVYNMISRYAKDEPVVSNIEGLPGIDKRPVKADTRTKRQYRKRERGLGIGVVSDAAADSKRAGQSEPFLISVNKTIAGEDARALLSGIGSALLPGRRYLLEVKVIEK